MLIKLLSARGIATAMLCIPTLNVTDDDAKCRHNRPLYIITQEATSDLKQVSMLVALRREGTTTWER